MVSHEHEKIDFTNRERKIWTFKFVFEITMFHDSINYPIQAFNSKMFLSKL